MAHPYHVIVALSDRTTIEYDVAAYNKIQAYKVVLAFLGYRGIKSIKSI